MMRFGVFLRRRLYWRDPENTNENTDALYTLHAYNLRGKEMFSKSLSFDYDNIFAGKDEIIVTGGNDCAIFRKNGSVKFEGELKSRIRSVVPSGKRLEYVVVYENETQVIKLKNALSEGSQRGTATQRQNQILRLQRQQMQLHRVTHNKNIG